MTAAPSQGAVPRTRRRPELVSSSAPTRSEGLAHIDTHTRPDLPHRSMARPQFFPIFQLAHILRGISQDPEGKSRMQHNPTYVDGERREMLRTMLLQLREHTCQRIKDFRREQRQESESGPGDYVDMARWSADVETHAGLIARAEEKLNTWTKQFLSSEQAPTEAAWAAISPFRSNALLLSPSRSIASTANGDESRHRIPGAEEEPLLLRSALGAARRNEGGAGPGFQRHDL